MYSEHLSRNIEFFHRFLYYFPCNSLRHDRARASNGPATGQRWNAGLLGRPYPFARREFSGAAALSEQEQRDTGGWHKAVTGGWHSYYSGTRRGQLENS